MNGAIQFVQMPAPDHPGATALRGKSWSLSALSVFSDDKILTFGAQGLDKGADLGAVFKDVKPRGNSEFKLELAAILPDRWPSFEGKADRSISVPLYYGEEIEICVSNQMLRLRYKVGDTFCHALCPGFFFKDVAAREKGPIPPSAHVESLSTMVSSRFPLRGENPGAALEVNIIRCVDRFLEAINVMLSAQMMVEDSRQWIPCQAIDRGVLGHIYLVLQGSDPNQYAMNRICLNPYRTPLLDRNYDSEETRRFEAYVAGQEQEDILVPVLHSANSYLEAGMFEQAMLQIALAADIATERFLNQELTRPILAGSNTGSSTGAVSTFEHKLNVLVPGQCPEDEQPNPSLINDMNRIGDLRDHLIKENALGASVSEMHRLHARVWQYARFLKQVDRQAKAA